MPNLKEQLIRAAPWVAVGLFGFGIAFGATSNHGPGVTPDSAHYLVCAEHIGESLRCQSFGRPFLHWPPLFPAVLSIANLGRIDAQQFARFLNAAVFGLIAAFGGWAFFRAIGSKWLAGVAAAALILSPALIHTSAFVWTEPLFTLFVLLMAIDIAKHAQSGGVASLIRAAVWAALACVTRYAGAFSAAAAIGLVFFLGGSRASKRRLIETAGFGIVSLVPLAIWLARNWSISKTLTGERGISKFSLSETSWQAADVLWSWLASIQSSSAGLSVMGILVLATAGWVIGLVLTRRREAASEIDHTFGLNFGWALVLPAFVSTTALIVLSARMQLDPIDARLMSPAYPAFIFLLFAGVEGWLLLFSKLARDSRRAMDVASLVIAIFAGIWVAAHPARALVRDWPEWRKNGLGFNAVAYQDDALMEWIVDNRANFEGAYVESNAHDLLYLHTKLEAAMLSVHEMGIFGISLPLKAKTRVFVVWSDRIVRGYHGSKASLRARLEDAYRVIPLIQNPDGEVWEIAIREHVVE
jgi:hypothetical protein